MTGTAAVVTQAAYGVVGLPLRRRLRHTTADTGELTVVLLRLTLATGHVGWAETRGNGEYATHHTTGDIVAALAGLPPVTDPVWGAPSALADALAERCPPAAMLLDVATRDAEACSRGLPLWATLPGAGPPGGRGPRSLATHAQIGFGTAEEAGVLAAEAARAGFGRIKIRVGGRPEEDRARVTLARRAVDRAVGAGVVAIAVDANGGWDPATAISATAWLADQGVAWLEQPTPPDDPAALAAVRSAARVPVWADESVRDASDVHALAALGAVDGVHLKLEKTGTVGALTAAVAAARGHGLDVGLGQMDCGRLGCATTTHLAAGLGTAVAELWGCANVARDVTEGLELRAGAVGLPRGPGLGVRVTVHPAELTPLGQHSRSGARRQGPWSGGGPAGAGTPAPEGKELV